MRCANSNRPYQDWKCDPRKRGVNDENCRFWLWEDHLPEAMKYHGVPEGAIQMTSPYKRKRDGDIRDWARTPRTLRTRDAMVDREDSLSGLYDTPTPSPREEMGHRSRGSCTKLPLSSTEMLMMKQMRAQPRCQADVELGVHRHHQPWQRRRTMNAKPHNK